MQAVRVGCGLARTPDPGPGELHGAEAHPAQGQAVGEGEASSRSDHVFHHAAPPERLDRHPVGVYDATWTLLSWNPLWAALVGDPSALDERARNTVWRHFTTGAVERVRQTPDEVRAFENSMVADLRARGRLDLLAALGTQTISQPT